MNLKEQQDELVKNRKNHLSELRLLIRKGDWKYVEQKTGLSQSNVHHAFNRIGSVHHIKVVEAIERSIKMRLDKFKRETSK